MINAKEKEVIYYCKQNDPYCASPNCRCNTIRPKEVTQKELNIK